MFAVAAIAAKEKRYVVTLDIGGAYLNASMKEREVLMRLDDKMAMILVKIRPEYEKFPNEDGSMIVQLDKALYGCVESAKLWYDQGCGGAQRNSASISGNDVRLLEGREGASVHGRIRH